MRFARAASPIKTGTMWLVDCIKGMFTLANMRFSLKTAACCASRSALALRALYSAKDTAGVSLWVEAKRSSFARRSLLPKSSPKPSFRTAPNSA